MEARRLRCSEGLRPSLKPNLSRRCSVRRPRSLRQVGSSVEHRTRADSSEEQVSKPTQVLQLASSATPQASPRLLRACSDSQSLQLLVACLEVCNPSSLLQDCSANNQLLHQQLAVFSAGNRRPNLLCLGAKRTPSLRVSQQGSLEQSQPARQTWRRAVDSLEAVEAQAVVVYLEPVPNPNRPRAVCLGQPSLLQAACSARHGLNLLTERAAGCSAELLLLPQEPAAASSVRAQLRTLAEGSLARPQPSSRSQALEVEASLDLSPSLDRLKLLLNKQPDSLDSHLLAPWP